MIDLLCVDADDEEWANGFIEEFGNLLKGNKMAQLYMRRTQTGHPDVITWHLVHGNPAVFMDARRKEGMSNEKPEDNYTVSIATEEDYKQYKGYKGYK